MGIFKNRPKFSLTGKKTLIGAALNIVLVFVPEVREFISSNPEFYASLVSFGGALLRISTKTPVGEATPIVASPVLADARDI